MKFVLMLPSKGCPYGGASLLVELAVIAEQAGCESFFLRDHTGGGGVPPTMVQESSNAGATWWDEEIFSGRGTRKQIRERIAAGPPRYSQHSGEHRFILYNIYIPSK